MDAVFLPPRRAIYLGGLVGTAAYEGDFAEFLPWLLWGQLVHVGKNATFGLGRIGVSFECRVLSFELKPGESDDRAFHCLPEAWIETSPSAEEEWFIRAPVAPQGIIIIINADVCRYDGRSRGRRGDASHI